MEIFYIQQYFWMKGKYKIYAILRYIRLVYLAYSFWVWAYEVVPGSEQRIVTQYRVGKKDSGREHNWMAMEQELWAAWQY